MNGRTPFEARFHARRTRRPPSRMSLNLTAMIDVTFLLLIYFLVATEFKLGEEVYRLDLPERLPASQQREPFELDREPLHVKVATVSPAACSIRLETRHARLDQPQSFEELFRFLESNRIGGAHSGGLFAADHPIIVEPAGTTTWQHVVQAFDAAARAHYTNITLGLAE